MNIVIDFESEIPIYIQLRNQIVKGIATKELESGYSLPSVRALAEDIGINMHTVNKAYNILKGEGYIILDRRHGATIAPSKKNDDDFRKFKDEFTVTICSCLAKDITKEEVSKLIEEIYKDLER